MPDHVFHHQLQVPNASRVTPRSKRVKIDVACITCRRRKVRCDGARPACGNCSRKLDLRETCNYNQSTVRSQLQRPSPISPEDPNHVTGFLSGQASSQAPDTQNPSNGAARLPNHYSGAKYSLQQDRFEGTSASITSQSPAGTLSSRSTEGFAASVRADTNEADHSPSILDSMTAVADQGVRTREFFGSSSAGSFTAQIRKALDARLERPGSAPTTRHTPSKTPAPQLVSTQAPIVADYVLPARRHADNLMALYWKYVDPLYPFLHKAKWDRSYEAIFMGTSTEIEEHVFVATLNTIFALSTRLTESLTPEQRDETSARFFQRAQDLIPLNIWHSGTTEQVQYLLLVSQYLQSTDYPQQTWMVVGSAVRMAQGLGLHLPDATSDCSDEDERELLRRIWHGCVLMDRVVAVTHGRPAMIPSHVARRVPLPHFKERTADESDILLLGNPADHASLFVKSVELYEIMYRTILAVHYSDEGPLPKCVANPLNRDLGGEDEDIATVIQLDGALRKWQRSLPKVLELHTDIERREIVHRQAVILHIRFLHARILLLRPCLTRFCLAQAAASTASEDSLQARMLEQSALLCVETAKRLISTLQTYAPEAEEIGLLPVWWYRVYYAYTAATLLIAANLRPEVFPASVLGGAWSQSMSVLQSHEKFGYSARRCVAALHMLFHKLLRHENDNDTSGAASTEPGANQFPAIRDQSRVVPVDRDPGLLLQPVEEFPFTFDDFDQLEPGDFDLDANNLAWLNDMHALWGQ